MVNVFREARDLCIEGDDNGVALITDETDCFDNDTNSVVCADSIALSSDYMYLRGRRFCPLMRWKL